MTTKNDIREEMRSRRKALAPSERSTASGIICRKLIDGFFPPTAANRLAASSPVIAVYLASRDEIDLDTFISCMLARAATLVSPRWNAETYELARIKSLSQRDIRTGPMGIREPSDANIVPPCEVDAWIIPGLAFTRRGMRLGYGGGWYDRLLAESRADSLKIGVGHGFQIVADLPSEPHDIRLDSVVTDDVRNDPPDTVS